MHVSPAESGNMYAPQLHRSMHSPSPERECVDSSPKVCVCACVHVRECGYTDLQTECRPKHKSGSCLCPSYRHAGDYRLVLLYLQAHSLATRTDGQLQTLVHTNFKPCWYEEADLKGGGAGGFCNYST